MPLRTPEYNPIENLFQDSLGSLVRNRISSYAVRFLDYITECAALKLKRDEKIIAGLTRLITENYDSRRKNEYPEVHQYINELFADTTKTPEEFASELLHGQWPDIKESIEKRVRKEPDYAQRFTDNIFFSIVRPHISTESED